MNLVAPHGTAMTPRIQRPETTPLCARGRRGAPSTPPCRGSCRVVVVSSLCVAFLTWGITRHTDTFPILAQSVNGVVLQVYNRISSQTRPTSTRPPRSGPGRGGAARGIASMRRDADGDARQGSAGALARREPIGRRQCPHTRRKTLERLRYVSREFTVQRT